MPKQMPTNSSSKHFYVKHCHKHLSLRTSNSMAKQAKKGKAITCHGCDGTMKSGGEAQAWRVLENLPGILVLHDDYTLQDKNPDFTLICTHTCTTLLLVQIDGEQHLKKNMHDTPLQQQAALDNTFDNLALHTGHRVLRMHCMDMSYFSFLLDIALQKARAYPQHSWVMYSAKYNRALRTL
jgi:hypothetical protein